MISNAKAAGYEPESYWKKRLIALQPLTLPFNQLEILAPGKGAGGKRKVAIPQEIGTLTAILPQSDFLVAAFSAFLSRFLNIYSFDIKYADASMLHNDAVSGETSLKYLPLHVDLDSENTFEKVCKGMQEELRRLSEYGNCFPNVLSDNSGLKTALDDFEKTVSISVVLVDGIEDIKSFDTKQITLIIPRNGAECMCFYDDSVLNQNRIISLLHHFDVFLRGTISNPALRISDLPLLNEKDQEQLLCEFNNTKMEYPKDKLLHDMFEEQVEKTPNSDAVIFKDKKITYKELNEYSNQLARNLRERGVRPDQIVGLMVDDNSIEMTIGMISILKAGGAFLPIDPNHPKDRIEYMIEDSNVAVLITQTKLKDKIQFGGEAIYLDKQSLFTGKCSNLEKINQPNDLVYVIYTSGSTGKPKGVQIEHTSIVNQIYGLKTIYKFESSLHHILLASITFDPSVQQIFLPLTTGGKLFLVPKSTKQSVKELWEFIVSNQIDIVNTVPSLMSILMDHADSYSDLHFKYIILAGEVLSKKLYLRLKESLSAEKIINIYGPTEATINTTLYECKPEEISSIIPIGKPLMNYNIMILDSHQKLLPVDVPGEICISGVGLARGYLNNPKLTAEKFISNPFTPGERMYRTGDLGRWTADGDIEFLGRIDHQVKIRGVRIELGEIEAVLYQHPTVQETVVIDREDHAGSTRLVAYVVPKHKQNVTIDELRRFLKDKLPDYMVPSAFVALDSLPLTAHGKVDRRALPEPKWGRNNVGEPFVSPHTSVEELLANIWREVLGLKQVGIHDNFFELGGDSLSAIRVIARVKNSLPMEIPLQKLFERPTIAELADEIDKILNEGEKQSAAIMPVSREEGLPLSFAQERLWFFDQMEPYSSVYNMRLTLRLTGDINMTALERSLHEILRRHEVLRTTFVTENGQPVQVVAPPGVLALPLTDLSEAPEEQREAGVIQLASEEASRPFDLAEGPLMRATLFRLNPQKHVLLLTVHHIVSDGWSMGILSQELSALYEAFSKGRPSPLAELPIQYADFAVWQRQWLQGEKLEKQLSYWKKQLGGDLPILELPTDYSRPAVQTHRGGHCSLQLSRELNSSLNALSQREGVTLFMTMLAAFTILLHRLSSQDDIIVGTPIAGRNCIETEGLIGVFLNTIVMRTDLSGNPLFCDVLGRIRKAALDAYVHQDLPFEKLVEELRPQRDLSHTPLFQVMLNMLNLSYNSNELPESREDMIELDSKFDLTLYVSPNDDGMILDLVYNADLFEGLRMTEMLEQMRYLLEQIVVDPEKPIRLYSLCTPRSAPFLPDPNAALPEPIYPSVTSMFLSHVDRAPNHPAVSQNGEGWTYKQLSESVYHLAGVLRSHGVEKGVVVAVTGPRSFEIIAGITAVLLSGAVLLAIDQNLPARRKRLMCQEAKAKCLLHIGDWQGESHWYDEIFPSGTISVDKDKGLAVDIGQSLDSSQTDLPELSPDDAAYIFFTSGTSGVPKGVLGCHKGLSHFLTWQRDTFAVGTSDRCAQLTNLSFDVVLRDIFLSLVSGATLCLPDESEGSLSDRVLSWLDREGITILNTVPSVAQSWLGSIPPGITLGSLRNVFFAGEPLRESLLRKWHIAFPDSGQIINLYGPTETTLAKCFFVLPPDIMPGIQPVGRPLPETQALVLSENGQLCGIGEVGEIVLRTPFRTIGYVNNSKEQQRRFMRNHFRDDPNDVVYYTGDLGRYLPDGSLTILGRLDDQVKIRGVRIEPDEVAAVLERHPLVRSSVVTARKNRHEEYNLVAYIVPSGQGKITVSELRSHLSKHLPDYMIPSAFVMLDSLPLTPNGKVDKKSLPAPESERPDLEDSFVSPHTPIEELLVGIWCEVLGLKKVGVHDNFFELGGHSLLAIRVMSRLRKVLQMDTPLRFLFEAPTPSGLATRIVQSQAEISDPEELARILAELEGPASDSVSGFREIENERYE